MNRNIIIFQEKPDFVIDAVSSILRIYFKLVPTIQDFDEEQLDSLQILPELVFVDEKILVDVCLDRINLIKKRFPDTTIIILTVGNNRKVDEELRGIENVENFNLWDSKISTIIKLNNIIRKNKIHLSRSA